MNQSAFDELLVEFEHEVRTLWRMSSGTFDPNRPYQAQEVAALRSRIMTAFRDATSDRWPTQESNGECRQEPRITPEASQGEAAGIRSAGPADTAQAEASRALIDELRE